MILRIEKHYCFLFEHYKCFNKKIFPRRHEIDKFYIDIEVYKIALFILQHAGFLHNCPYCIVNCSTEIPWCTMSYIPSDFILARSCSFLFIDVLELKLMAEKLQRHLRLIHGQEHLMEKINILSRRAQRRVKKLRAEHDMSKLLMIFIGNLGTGKTKAAIFGKVFHESITQIILSESIRSCARVQSVN